MSPRKNRKFLRSILLSSIHVGTHNTWDTCVKCSTEAYKRRSISLYVVREKNAINNPILISCGGRGGWLYAFVEMLLPVGPLLSAGQWMNKCGECMERLLKRETRSAQRKPYLTCHFPRHKSRNDCRKIEPGSMKRRARHSNGRSNKNGGKQNAHIPGYVWRK